MMDEFMQYADGPSTPARGAIAIVPDDEALLAGLPKAIYVGGGGSLAMRGAGDERATIWRGVPAGGLIPFRAVQVLATGTTATDLLALY